METTMLISADLDAAFWVTIIAILALLILSAFFSGSETALTAASRGKLHSLAEQGSRGAKRALLLTDDNERLIGSVLLGNNLVNILATALATSLFTRLFGESGVALATLVMTILVLIFAEVLPKTYAISNAEAAATGVSAPIRILVIVLSPIVAAVQTFVRIVLTFFGVKMAGNDTEAAQEEIAGAIALGHVEGNFQKDDRDRLLGALDLKDREVEEIMLHRSDIEMIDVDDEPQSIVRQCLDSSHTRLPLYKDDPENIVGVIHAKDLLRVVERLLRNGADREKAMSKLKILDIAMKPYFVPETTTLDDQMRQFLVRHTHFALVVDEYGALQGLITLEDILEEIVGEITDEHDTDDDELEQNKDAKGNYDIDGAATIRDVNRSYDWNLPDEEANTVAGLVIYDAQMIPNIGQVFSFHGYRFQIMEREQNRITKLKVRPLS